jgi:hypothetical protein
MLKLEVQKFRQLGNGESGFAGRSIQCFHLCKSRAGVAEIDSVSDTELGWRIG